MAVKPATFGPFIRGVDASTGVLTQPKGSIPRGSNLLFSKRGSLRTCDGTGFITAFEGVPDLGLGPILCGIYFTPIGVTPYYLLLIQDATGIGAPQNLVSSDGGAGGTLAASTTYYYKITACDGIGGETGPSNEASYAQTGTPHKVTLTWNIVPNAVYYNVYRGTVSGGEIFVGGATTVLQPALGSLTVTFTDDGTDQPVAVALTSVSSTVLNNNTQYVFQTSTPHTLIAGARVTVSGVTPSGYNAINNVYSVPSNTSFVIQVPGIGNTLPGTGGNVNSASPSGEDTTQQLALYKIPGPSYSDADIVAYYPINPAAATALGSAPGFGQGPKTLKSIVVAPAHSYIFIGKTVQLKATGSWADGTTSDISTLVSWVSSGFTAISSSGLVTGESAGSDTISASYSGMTGTATVVVRDTGGPF